MSHQATLIYTESLMRRAVFEFWRRSVGIGFAIALLVLTVGLGVLIAQGAASWLVGALATVLVLGVAFIVALYFVHYRSSVRKFRELGNAEAKFQAEELSFTFSSSVGSTTLQWSTVKELWQFSDVWLFLYSKAQFSTLPLAGLSPDMRLFVLQRVRASGGKVDR